MSTAIAEHDAIVWPGAQRALIACSLLDSAILFLYIFIDFRFGW